MSADGRAAAAVLKRVTHVDVARSASAGMTPNSTPVERRHGKREHQNRRRRRGSRGPRQLRRRQRDEAGDAPAGDQHTRALLRRRATSKASTSTWRDDVHPRRSERELHGKLLPPAAARVSIRFARFAHAISSTAPTAANSVRSAVRNGPTMPSIDRDHAGRRACARSRPGIAAATGARWPSARPPPAPAIPRREPAHADDEIHRVACAAPRIPIGRERQHELDIADRHRRSRPRSRRQRCSRSPLSRIARPTIAGSPPNRRTQNGSAQHDDMVRARALHRTAAAGGRVRACAPSTSNRLPVARMPCTRSAAASSLRFALYAKKPAKPGQRSGRIAVVDEVGHIERRAIAARLIGPDPEHALDVAVRQLSQQHAIARR